MTGALLVLALGGCKKVEDVPTDLDGALHYLWQSFDGGTDAELSAAILSLDLALDGQHLDDPTDGTLSDLTRDEAAIVGVTRDPALAAGIFEGDAIHCAIGTVARVVTDPDQDGLYPGVYDSYSRSYDGDVDAFLAGDPDELAWSIDYTASVLGASYTAHSEATFRRIQADDDAPFDQAYVARYFAPAPAVFEEGSSKTLDQDYQLEAYWSRKSGTTLHAYAMWRQADWGSGFTSDDESVQRLVLNGMEDWDDDTDQICEDGY